MSEIHTLNGSQPHPDYHGWEGFLKTIDVRDTHDGVTYYGSSNCNYIVFPDGTLVENFGYHGRNTMNRVREVGATQALAEIKQGYAEYKQAYGELCDSIANLTADTRNE